MTSYYWIKLYHEILDDPKMALLPDRLWRRVVELFVLAGKYGTTGVIPDSRSIAWLLRMEYDELEMDMKQIATTGIIEPVTNGWLVVNFAKRQAAVSGADRVQQHRKRVKKLQYYEPANTPDNSEVTQLKRVVTQINRLTESDIDTDTDKDLEDITAAATTANVQPFGQLYDAFLDATKIAPTMLNERKAADTIREWVSAKITPGEVKQAVEEMQQKELTIVGPWSVTNAINIVRSKGSAKKKMSHDAPEARKKYAEWEK